MGIGASLSGGGKCLARDLYIPRCLLEGDMVVCSSHTLNPWIRASVSRGCMLHSVGDILDFMLHSKSLVYSSIGSSSIAAMPLRTC